MLFTNVTRIPIFYLSMLPNLSDEDKSKRGQINQLIYPLTVTLNHFIANYNKYRVHYLNNLVLYSFVYASKISSHLLPDFCNFYIIFLGPN